MRDERLHGGQALRRSAATREYSWTLFLLSAVLLHLLPLHARAQYAGLAPREPERQGDARAGWEFHPTISVEETYTDNVRLSRRGRESSDWVTQVRPGFTLRNVGPRLRLDLTYAPELVYRSREETHDVYQHLRGVGSAEVVGDLLFVDAQAYATRQNVSALGPVSTSDVNNTGNRTSVRAYNVSPYLRRDFGQAFQGELRFTHSAVEYGTSDVFSSEAERIDAIVRSGPAYRRLTWNAAYVKEHVRYTETGQSVDLERISAGARQLITANAGVLLNAGYEDNNYLTVGPAPRGRFWSIGPEWTPTPRTRVAATTGRRFFGRTRTLDFSHRTRLSTWVVQYDEDLTTGRGQVFVPTAFDTAAYLDTLLLARIPEANARRAAVQTLIAQAALPSALTTPVNYVTTVPFVQKRLQASFGLNGVRNTVFANAYRQTRDASAADAALGQAAAGDLALSPRTVQTGGGLLWSLRLSPVTTSNLTVDVMRSEFPAIDRHDTVTSARLALVRRLQPHLTGTVAVRTLQNRSNVEAAEYREKAVTVGLHLTF